MHLCYIIITKSGDYVLPERNTISISIQFHICTFLSYYNHCNTRNINFNHVPRRYQLKFPATNRIIGLL